MAQTNPDYTWDELLNRLYELNDKGLGPSFLADKAVVKATPWGSPDGHIIDYNRTFQFLPNGTRAPPLWVIEHCPYFDPHPDDLPTEQIRTIAVELLATNIDGH